MKAAQSLFFIRYVGWTHVLYGFFFRDDMILFSSNDITKTKMHSMECNDKRYRAIPLYFNPNNPCFKDDRITTRRRKRWGKTIYNTSLVKETVVFLRQYSGSGVYWHFLNSCLWISVCFVTHVILIWCNLMQEKFAPISPGYMFWT